MLTPHDLHPYQRQAIDFSVGKKSFGLFLPMGLGKTVITLTIIANRKRFSLAYKTLIIAPKAVASNVWPGEHAKWSHLGHMRVCRFDDKTPDQELKDADVVVTHFEQLEKFINRMPAAAFTMMVIDESSRIKNASSQRFKLIKQLAKIIPARIILTGTPMPQGLQDIWSQVGILDFGERLGKTLTAFRDRFLTPEKIDPRSRVVWKWKARPGAEAEVVNQTKDIILSIDRDSNLRMPELTVTDHNIAWNGNDYLSYKQFINDMVIDIQNETITAVSAGALVNKMLQYTSGSLYAEDGGAVKVQRAKLDYLCDLLEDAPPTIVFYNYKSALADIKLRLPHARCYNNDPDVLTAWGRGEIPVLLLHPQSAGLGLNLQCNVADYSQIMWYDLPWSGEFYQQANGRLFRQGQEKPVIIHHLMMANSVDQRVLGVLQNKITLEAAVLSALQQNS